MKNALELQEITPEYVMQLGEELIDAVLEATPADKAMKIPVGRVRLPPNQGGWQRRGWCAVTRHPTMLDQGDGTCQP